MGDATRYRRSSTVCASKWAGVLPCDDTWPCRVSHTRAAHSYRHAQATAHVVAYRKRETRTALQSYLRDGRAHTCTLNLKSSVKNSRLAGTPDSHTAVRQAFSDHVPRVRPEQTVRVGDALCAQATANKTAAREVCTWCEQRSCKVNSGAFSTTCPTCPDSRLLQSIPSRERDLPLSRVRSSLG